jgi:hypothetical protein
VDNEVRIAPGADTDRLAMGVGNFRRQGVQTALRRALITERENVAGRASFGSRAHKARTFEDRSNGFEIYGDYPVGRRGTPDWRRSLFARLGIGCEPEAAMDQPSRRSAIGVLFVISFFAAFIAIVVRFG